MCVWVFGDDVFARLNHMGDDGPTHIYFHPPIYTVQESRHRTVMITGDSELTAAEVARLVGMVPHGPERCVVLLAIGCWLLYGWVCCLSSVQKKIIDTCACA